MDTSKAPINHDENNQTNMECTEEQPLIGLSENLKNEMNSRNLSRIEEEFNRSRSRQKPRKSLVDLLNDIKNPQNQTFINNNNNDIDQNTANLTAELRNSAYRTLSDSNDQLMTQIQTNVNNQNIINTQLQMIKNINNLNSNNTSTSNNATLLNSNLTTINNLPNLSNLQSNTNPNLNPNVFNYLDIAGLINQAKENELAIRHQSLQRAISAEKNLNKIELATKILDQTRNQFQHQQQQQQQQQQQHHHHQQQVVEQQQQHQVQQANSIDAAPPTPERINANQFHLQNLQNLQNQNSSSTLASQHNTNNVNSSNHVIYNQHPQSHVTNTCNVTSSRNYSSSSPIVQHNNNNNNSNNATTNSVNIQKHTQHSNRTHNNTSNNNTPPKNSSNTTATNSNTHGNSRKNSNNNNSPYQRMSIETRLQMAEKLNAPASSIQDSIEDVKKVFVEFNHFIKMMRWTIAFIANEFDYSPTRMGEILKFQNIKNGKRKIPEWIKLSRKMLRIMNDNIVKQEYEQLFQNFQANKQNRNQSSSRTVNTQNNSSIQNSANGIQSNVNTGNLMMNSSLPGFAKNDNSNQENNSDTRFIGQEALNPPRQQQQQHHHQQRKFN